jgi:AcrR family transcriptional regulator
MSEPVNNVIERTVARWEPESSSRLQEAALSLFVERGYDQTTVSEIAARAGVTERTFYRHYTDKREVLFSGVSALQELLAESVRCGSRDATPMQLVLGALDTVGSLIEQRPARWVAQRHVVISATPELHERELIKMATLGATLAEALRERGVSELDATFAAEVAITIFRVGFERWVRDPEKEPLARAIRGSLEGLRAVTAPV